MSKEIVRTDKAPAAVGPYSQAVRAGGWVFVSGQVPIDPQTGEVVSGSVEEQARQALENVQAVLEGADLTLDHVVKATVFLTDMESFQRVNGVYASFFASDPPARACVEVSRLPKGADVEVEAVAYAG